MCWTMRRTWTFLWLAESMKWHTSISTSFNLFSLPWQQILPCCQAPLHLIQKLKVFVWATHSIQLTPTLTHLCQYVTNPSRHGNIEDFELYHSHWTAEAWHRHPAQIIYSLGNTHCLYRNFTFKVLRFSYIDICNFPQQEIQNTGIFDNYFLFNFVSVKLSFGWAKYCKIKWHHHELPWQWTPRRLSQI